MRELEDAAVEILAPKATSMSMENYWRVYRVLVDALHDGKLEIGPNLR
jgi:hypothetical protein